ncbi:MULTISPECIES: urea ABC transporter permease subunit UrtB [unclassified Psychrobacter]|uniref:urea ABC transporter permease subunit UrtB n=1 Tax=unclassified Psychrobacter TaxID=196806 RepID=UPI00268F4E51|nr:MULTISPECIES: urea ABC transporter permease subunit UrtB [unclassified Psychrobacter]|tara:strand:+ start:60130 stop:61959 length:1830 start_codon:yes stop_codon:yes gene_type:complete
MQHHTLRPFVGQTSSKNGNNPQASASEVMQYVARFSIHAPLRLLALMALCITTFTTTAYADHDGQVHDHDTDTVHSEQSLVTPVNVATSTQASISDTSTATSTSSGDAIQQFVAGDFSKRQAMLSDWPGSVESLDSLVEFIANDELYQGNGGQTYLLNKEDQLFTYPDKKGTNDWPSDLSQITLTNALRSALIFGQAKVKLASDKPAQRLQAVEILADNIDQVDPAIIMIAAGNEDSAKVKKALTALQARIDFKNGDLPTQIAAVNLLADSDNPQVLVDIESALAADNLDASLKAALIDAESSVSRRIEISTWTGHIFTGMSTASILLLAALGLAITFGLLGVINMAHGELIMIGAYTTYMVQNFFQAYMPDMAGWYLLAAIPAAFLVSAVIGMIIERIVIRPLYGRELETLLATFGVSLILMQLVRMIFGAQNVEVSNVAWLSGAYQVSSSLVLPYNRIAIIVFTVIVVALLVYLLNKTRFGLFIRAVTQNRQMARAVGIPSARIDMMAFGLGSGLAGMAGCALAQVGNVGPDLGQTYIIDTFLVVVVGGVGQVWGAVLAALGLGVSGTVLEIGIGAVLAKIVLLVLVILFIQKRPQGLFALKGRFVE